MPEPPEGSRLSATVLQVLPALGAEGGVERGTIEVAAAIVNSGGRALVASAGGPGAARVEAVGGVHATLPLDTKRPWAVYANAERLARLIREHRVDLVHARSRAPAWSAWLAARRTGVPLVTTFHGTYGSGSAAKRAYNRVMTRGMRVIAISQHITEHLQAVYQVAPKRIRTIPRGVDGTLFDPDTVDAARIARLRGQWGLTDGVPVILLPGRLTRWKGQTVFLDALTRMSEHDYQAVLLGSEQGRMAYRAELDRMIGGSHLRERVRIVEACDDMPAAMLVADIVVSASTDPEAFGRIAIEGQAMGTPVIATDHGGSRETVVPGTTGWLVPPGDADALAATLSEALSASPDRLQALGDAGHAHVHRNFTTRTMCDRTLAVYREVLAEAHQAG